MSGLGDNTAEAKPSPTVTADCACSVRVPWSRITVPPAGKRLVQAPLTLWFGVFLAPAERNKKAPPKRGLCQGTVVRGLAPTAQAEYTEQEQEAAEAAAAI